MIVFCMGHIQDPQNGSLHTTEITLFPTNPKQLKQWREVTLTSSFWEKKRVGDLISLSTDCLCTLVSLPQQIRSHTMSAHGNWVCSSLIHIQWRRERDPLLHNSLDLKC